MVDNKDNIFPIRFSEKLRNILDLYVQKKNTSISKLIKLALYEKLKKEGYDIDLIDFF
jgi:hypothetical protein